MEKGLHFVKADMEYVDVVFQWANDVTTRENAFNTNPIPYHDHIRWYSKKIDEESTLFYICKENDLNVGQLRLELEGNRAVISYSVDKDQRGRGLGKKIIKYAEELIRDNNISELDEVVLVGKVKKTNIASQKCFLTEGYSKEILEDYVEFTKVVSV